MFEPDHTLQQELFAFTHRELVSEDSDVWLYIDLFESLDLSEFRKNYRGQGQVAKEPGIILRTIFYGLTHGVVSGRKLEDVCKNDNRFIVLSGGSKPDKRTIHRFLIRHSQLMPQLFVKVVRLAQEMGLISLGRVAVDGSRFKGNTSSIKTMRYDKMQRAVGYIEDELKKLREDLASSNAEEVTQLEDRIPEQIKKKSDRLAKIREALKTIEQEHKEKDRARSEASPRAEDQKSLNDPDALSLSHKSKGFMFGYNLQAAVEEKNQIIVAAQVHNKATDYQGLPILLEQIKANCDQSPSQILADLGFKSAENVIAIEQHNAEPIVAVNAAESGEIDNEFFEQVEPTGRPNEYRCMRGKILSAYPKKKNGRTEFSLRKGFCQDCPFAESCKAYGKNQISIPEEQNRLAIVRLHNKSKTIEFKESYKRRKAIVEPVFGNIKNKGLRILVKGKNKVSTWWQIVCIAHNLEKIIKRFTPRSPIPA
jgi:transposase